MQTTYVPRHKGDNFFDSLLNAHSSQLGPVFTQPEKYHLQVIYTRIDRDSANQPHFQDHYYHIIPYFYPASTIKLAGAALALEKLNDLGLSRTMTMITQDLPGVSKADTGSVASYINKILTVSDNNSFNRLYEFLGQEYFNKTLWEKGYTDVQIRHRVGVGGISPEGNRHTNGVRFVQDDHIIYEQPAQYSDLIFPHRHDQIGSAYYDGDKLIHHPMDASAKNRFPLPDLHNVLKSIIFPEAVTKARRFRLNDDDYHFLYRCMSGQPEESGRPAYDTAAFPHNYVKFLLAGGKPNELVDHANVRIFNKPGWAYGFMTDVAYVVDFTKGVEFMLSASVYVNDDGILSDTHYQFDTIGKPFLRELGEVIYQYELQRKKQYLPDLSRYRVNYNEAAE
jgi:hypothetical protein